MAHGVTLFHLHRGESPLVVDVPHAGTLLPPEIAARMTIAGREVPDTDWHVEKLWAFARDAGATLMVATHSRYVVDLNRDPSGAALYPGADNTELCPTRTFDNAPVYREGEAPEPAAVAARRAAYFDPYHAALAAELERVRLRRGHVVLVDGHSIRSEVPRFFAGRLPDLNLGTADGASCAPAVQAIAVGALAAAREFSGVINGRFTGGYVTRHYGDPGRRVHALQLEIAQRCYMDEIPPWRWDCVRAAPLGAVLARLVEALLAWSPG